MVKVDVSQMVTPTDVAVPVDSVKLLIVIEKHLAKVCYKYSKYLGFLKITETHFRRELK